MKDINFRKISRNGHDFYCIEIDGLCSSDKICENCGITLKEYYDLFKSNHGKFSSKYGHYFSNKDDAESFCVLLSLIIK